MTVYSYIRMLKVVIVVKAAATLAHLRVMLYKLSPDLEAAAGGVYTNRDWSHCSNSNLKVRLESSQD